MLEHGSSHDCGDGRQSSHIDLSWWPQEEERQGGGHHGKAEEVLRDPEPEYDNGVGSKALAEEKVAVSDSLAKESEYRSDADNRVPARGRLSGMTLGRKSL